VKIEHEGDECAFHLCPESGEDREARTGHLGGTFLIENTEPGSKIDMILWGKILGGEVARCPPAPNFKIAGFIVTDRNRVVRQIRDIDKDGAEIALEFFEARLDTLVLFGQDALTQP
jgi:hypothetical protein